MERRTVREVATALLASVGRKPVDGSGPRPRGRLLQIESCVTAALDSLLPEKFDRGGYGAEVIPLDSPVSEADLHRDGGDC